MRLAAAVLAVASALSVVAADDACIAWPVAAGACSLIAGQPATINGSHVIVAGQEEQHYFKFSVDKANAGDVTVSLTVWYGDSDLYITKPSAGGATRKPTLYDNDFQAMSTGQHDEIVIANSQLADGVAEYGVLVNVWRWGGVQSAYSLVVQDANTPTVLYEGSPVRDSVEPGSYSYFEFTVPAAETSREVIIEVTPLSGDPDLIVNECTGAIAQCTKPTIHQADHSSRVWGGDVVTITSETHFANKAFYIGVYGFSRTSFMISVRTSAPVTLVDGVPQIGRVGAHGEAYFFVLTDGSAEDVSLTVTPVDGSVTMFVRENVLHASEQNFHWRSSWNSFTQTQLTLWHTDAHFLRRPGNYSVLVKGGTRGSNFTITSSHSNSVVALQDGIPFDESIGSKRYEYFMISVDNATHPLDIDLTAYSGDPDIFVSCSINATGTDAGTPSRINPHYTWSSRRWGRDTVHISGDDPNHCSRNNPRGGTFYIAVYGYRNASFSLTASSDPEEEGVLLDGRPQYGLTVGNSGRRFRFWIPAEVNGSPTPRVTLELAARYGDPDLYVAFNREPTTTDSDARSRLANSRDVVELKPGVPNYRSGAWAHILVYGFRTSAFTLTGSTDEAIVTLQDGVPVQEHLERTQTEHFSFYKQQAGGRLSIVATPLMGDPDIYVSTVDPHPSSASYNWSAANWGDDAVILEDAQAGQYFIGVTAFTNTTFTLQAHVSSGDDDDRLVQMSPGVPQAGSVEALAMRHYIAHVGTQAPDHAAFTLTVRRGRAQLYINRCTADQASGEQGCRSQQPTVQDKSQSAWPRNKHTPATAITIDKTDPMACTDGAVGCSYVIGVYGSTDADFSLTYSTSFDVITLQDRVPFRSSVTRGEYAYFHFTLVTPHMDVSAQITPINGDPDLFLSWCTGAQETAACDRPTRQTHDKASAVVGGDQVLVPAADMTAHCPNLAGGEPCEFFIGVYGFSNTTFTITVLQSDNHPVSLVAGQPQSGQVQQRRWMYYEAEQTPGHAGMEIMLSPVSGDVDLYVKLASTTSGDDSLNPTTTSFDYVSRRASGIDRITITASDTQWRSKCQNAARCYMRVGVYGYRASDFIVLATELDQEVTLVDGQPLRSTVRFGRQRSFAFYLGEKDKSIQIALTPVQGSVVMAVAMSTIPTAHFPGPSWAGAVWLETHPDSDVLRIDSSNPCANAVSGAECGLGEWQQAEALHIAVAPTSWQSEFSLTVARVGEMMDISEGEPTSSVTVTSDICASVGDRGQCTARKTARIATFAFNVDLDEIADGKDPEGFLQITVTRQCGSTASAKCTTAALDAYVSYCDLRSSIGCTGREQYKRPSPVANQASLLNVADTGTLTILPGQPAYCSSDSDSDTCKYHVTVVSEDDVSVPFTISFTTQSGIHVLPSDAVEDKVAVREGALPATEHVVYEVWAGNFAGSTDDANVLRVTLEPCYGFPVMYLCSSFGCPDPLKPSASQWEERLDTFDVKGLPFTEQRFAMNEYYLNVTASPSTTAPPTTSFRMFSSTGDNWALLRPGHGDLSSTAKDSTSLSVSWTAASFQYPNGSVATADAMSYRVSVVEKSALSTFHRPDTSCGLAHIRSGKSDQITSGSSLDMSGLKPGTAYVVNVVAIGTRENQEQQVAFTPTTVTTPAEQASIGWIVFGVIVGTLALAAIPLFLFYRRSRRLERQLQYEMEDVRNVATVSADLPGLDASASYSEENSGDALADRISQYRTL